MKLDGNIELIIGDITSSEADAIVNAANPKMLGGGGVDGAIHRAAGAGLLDACRKVKAVNGIRCPFGEARITSAGNLRSKYVIHAAGPIYRNEQTPASVLESAYRSACELAIKNGCHSVAFPAISCGAYGYPYEEAAQIAVHTCRQYPQLYVTFYLIDKALADVFRSVI
ncbi:macro domain-containing protein [Pseudoalteromonas obscura]|uniref:Macro domain-containing protein n=1 Tax=Pseudoalteromonas obscura TaxID=3048491 RepID=A0ABT7EFA0_9GAMM|nr:macro domain-containing protein [Pseudoalteromonas sp. P94(2023)]MDK2593950.1 macro domain-containing protein [Pseudoalteromonas sp. P94(2023)]